MSVRRWVATSTAGVVLIAGLGACGSDGSEITAPATATSAPADPTAHPAYAEPGPYGVGLTHLETPERGVEVYYPTGERDGSDDGELEPSDDAEAFPGPWPVVLFSHGFGGTALGSTHLLTGIASWGFVIASTDYEEHNAEAVERGTARIDTDVGAATTLETLGLLGDEQDGDGILAGILDLDLVAAVGHSAGGGTVVALHGNPEIDAIVGWAPFVTTQPSPTGPPTLFIGGALDPAVTPEVLRERYAALPPPKRLIVIDDAGHGDFVDSCFEVYARGELAPEEPSGFGSTGCYTDNLDPAIATDVIQHLTVAHLRAALGIDDPPVGLGDGITTAFEGVTMSYAHGP